MLREMTVTSGLLFVGCANAAQACGSDPMLWPIAGVFVAGYVGAAVLAVATVGLAATRLIEKLRRPRPVA